ncbi:hypothetical protein HOO65_060629 [Ceratocystis lukuohia]|uniref:PHD-type domain-containing protein n=1 Tax=Ceratocystis lukuohia TaxID=2019550 RepID=A0ABR4MEV9_9PEZI
MDATVDTKASRDHVSNTGSTMGSITQCDNITTSLGTIGSPKLLRSPQNHAAPHQLPQPQRPTCSAKFNYLRPETLSFQTQQLHRESEVYSNTVQTPRPNQGENTTAVFTNTIQELSRDDDQSHDITSPLSAPPSLPRSNSGSPSHSHSHALTTSDEVAAMMALRDLKETPPMSSTSSITSAKLVYCPEPPSALKLPAQEQLPPSSKPYRRQFKDASARLVLSRANASNGLKDIVSTRFEESRRRNEAVTVAVPAKRKRADLDEESDRVTAGAALQPLPKISKPVPRKKKLQDGISRCSKCERQAYTQDNALVGCSRCDELWHQLCHSPEIGKETAGAPSGWECSICLVEEDELARYNQARQEMLASARRQTDVDALREKYFQSLPLGVSIPSPELVGFGPGETSEDVRFDYFSSLDRYDQLALLGFCDKLQPNLLAEVLATVSSRYPALALFGSPDWACRIVSDQSSSLSTPLPAATTTASTSNIVASVLGAELPNNVRTPLLGSLRARLHMPLQKHLINTVALSRKPNNTRVYIPRRDLEALQKRESAANNRAALSAQQTPATPTLASSKSATPTDDEVDALPSTWPRPGHGMYANLLSETVDAKHLLDPHDTIAFHHFTIDQRGKLLPKMAVAALV